MAMATTALALSKCTISVKEFEWNLKLLLTVVYPEGIKLDTLSDKYKKYLNENIDPGMLKANSKHWITVFQSLPLLCKSFELFEHHALSCTYVKIRPVENSSKNIEDEFIKKIFQLANYKKASLLSHDKPNTSDSEYTAELEINNSSEETESKSDFSCSTFSPKKLDISSEEEEEKPTASKRKCTDSKSTWKNQLNPDFTILYKTYNKDYESPRPGPRTQVARRYERLTLPAGNADSYLFSYKCKGKKGKYLCTQHNPNEFSCVIASGDTVYEIGGTEYSGPGLCWNEPKPEDTLIIYKAGKVTNGPKLIQPAWDASACIVEDSLYLIGGVYLSRKLNTLQGLNLNQEDQCWKLLKNMNRKRSDFDVAVVGNYIYAIGGKGYVGGGRINCLKSGEVYNTANNSWENIPDMNFPRSDFNTCPLDRSLIYAISRKSDGVNTMEQYNCELKNWKSMADLLPKSSLNSQVAVPSNNLIFLLGNAKMKEEDKYSNFIEVYDPRINQWNTLHYQHYFRISPDAEFITCVAN